MPWSFRRSKKTADDVVVDRTTGAFNRRRLDRDIAAGVDPFGLPTATLIIHVDNLDDRVDEILERIAWVVMAAVRTRDTVYRDSDFRFCVRLSETTDEQASLAAERIRSNIASTPILTHSNVMVSVEVATGESGQAGNTSNPANDAAATPGEQLIVDD